MGFPHRSVSTESACNAGDPGSTPGSGRSPGEEMANHSSIPSWKIPWTEETGGLQAMGRKELDTAEQLSMPAHSLQKLWIFEQRNERF